MSSSSSPSAKLFSASAWILAAALGLAISGSGAILDALAISVGNQAITEHQIDDNIRLAAFSNNEQPDFSVESRRKAADRLIEQALVRREMAFGAYPAIPTEQVDSAVSNTEKAHGGIEGLDDALARYGLDRKQLRDYLGWQLQLLSFIDLRFRPAIQVTNEDVEKYYKETVAAAHPGTTAPPLSQLRAEIEQKLTGERVDKQLDEWISRSRKRTVIRYIDKTLGETSNAEVHVETAQPH